MSSHLRTLRRSIQRRAAAGDPEALAGRGLKPPPPTMTHCFACRRVVRIDRTANRDRNVCPQCWADHHGGRSR